MSTIKQLYGTQTTVTMTLASLASGSAREGVAIDNTGALYEDAVLVVVCKINGSPTGVQQTINIWFAMSADGTVYTGPATGTDSSITLRTQPDLLGPFPFPANLNNEVCNITIGSVARFFGGRLPPHWSVIVDNESGVAFTATPGDHSVKYTGVNDTVS